MAAGGDPLSTGYGPRNRLMFDGDSSRYELWECKFLGYMRLKKLLDVIVKKEGEAAVPSADKLAEAYAELIQFLDDRSLALIMRDCKDDGRKALSALRQYYMGTGKPRVMSLYAELSGMQLRDDESVTDYMIRGETAAASLKTAGEEISDSLIVAMLLNGLSDEFKTFCTVVNQREKAMTVPEFKEALRNFEETEKIGSRTGDGVMKAGYQARQPRHDVRGQQSATCYNCGKQGHKSFQCGEKKNLPVICYTCGREGHKSTTCSERKKKPRFGGYRPKRDAAKVACKEEKDDTKSRNNDDHFAFKISYADEIRDDVKSCVDELCGDEIKSLLVDCGATAHIVTDKDKFTQFDKYFDPSSHYIELADGSRTNNIVLGKGQATVLLYDVNGAAHNVTLENALYIPSFNQDIFSVQSAVERGARVNFTSEMSKLVTVDGTSFEFEKQGKLYYLNKLGSDKYSRRSLEEWHRVLGHCNMNDILLLENVVSGMKIENPGSKDEICENCVYGKMHKTFSRLADAKATKPLEFVHTDLAGPVDPIAKDGYRFAINFVDDYSGVNCVYFLKHKGEAYKALEKFLADTAPFGTVKRLRCDNGTEYLCENFKSVLLKNKIRQETSAPYSPHQNGTSERGWRTLFETARCMIAESGLPKRLWTFAVLASAYIRNRCYNSRLAKTPYEAFTGKVPDVSGMHVFGSTCYAYVEHKSKLDARSEKGRFVGYDRSSPAYLVYFPSRDEIRRVRCVKFTEKFEMSDDKRIDVDGEPLVINEPLREDVVDGNNEPPRENVVDENVNVENENRYPRRERGRPQYLNDYVVDNANLSVDYCYLTVPSCYDDAVKSDESVKWQKAMREEYDALVENDTFELTEIPEDKLVVGGKWVYSVKQDQNGEKFKARYVAKGYSQTPDVDYRETFAPTARMTSIRMLLQLAIQEDMLIHQMDVKTAYLNAPIDCDIFMEQPEGYEKHNSQGDKLVWKLRKSLYGLKQSGRNWNNLLHDFLVNENFVRSMSDPCVYTKTTGQSKTILIIWVDDIIIASSDEMMLKEVKMSLSAKFKMKDLGRLSYFLGIEFVHDRNCISMSQKMYIEKLLERFNLSECRSKATPCEVASGSLKVEDSSPLDDTRLYRELVGSLIYLMTCTRPDICFVVTKLSQFLACPTKAHLAMGKHVLKYLKGTIDCGLKFEKADKLELQGFCDSDWGSSVEDRKSVTGFGFQLCDKGPLISWKSKKQQCVALSSCEAEYIAVTVAAQEAKFLKQLYHDMVGSQNDTCVCIHVDNQGAIALAKNPVKHQRSKHIDIRYHFIRDEIQNGTIRLEYVPTELNVADVFTKPVSRVRFNSFGIVEVVK